ncbi:hypothetical protein ORI89_17230 [Sphingobacterium sp. UT-1RO-CII-1]|uniref:hypothetical protein n=1 Tax=Sphingobacterium sp. UT-1RO-CII-1 TaxID=2995225 RepID=UPI00227C701E|nr:hypothetical protein [Sphingobacterium sp. UT-1RO-CII-1]MCY4781405.1 hypothetical protein [Sphingobacterium sp. UT-1RO-CII-1]
MDFSTLIVYHSYYRWIVLSAMLLQIGWIFIEHKRKSIFTIYHFRILLLFTLIFNIQLLIGWLLFTQSTIAHGFWENISQNIKNRQMRFFGLEHVSMMSLGIILSNIYTILAYRKRNQKEVFTYLWKRYLIIYLIILSSIPWSFSPLTSRPNFR